LTSIRQKSGKKIEKSPVKSVRFIFDVKLTKIRQKSHKQSGKKIEKKSGFVRSCPVRPDQSQTAGPVPTLIYLA
jgi:hypothetical protein